MANNTYPWPQVGSVGVGTTSPLAPLHVVAQNAQALLVANTSGNSYAQMQGAATQPLARTLALGFPAPNDFFDSRQFGTAAYIVAEYEGYWYAPLHLNPIGGQVRIGMLAPPGPPDADPSGGSASGGPLGPGFASRFGVYQTLTTGEVVMADFVLDTTSPFQDSGAGRFVARQAGGTGGGYIRGLEAHGVRWTGAQSNTVRGIEIGCHSAVTGTQTGLGGPVFNVGAYVTSDAGFITGSQTGVRNDAGVLVEGTTGWWYGIVYRDLDNQTVLFSVDRYGNIGAAGSVTAQSFNQISSRALKKEIAQFSIRKAESLLEGLDVVQFRYKSGSCAERRIGFVAEDVPTALADSDSIRIPDVVAVLARVVREHQRKTHDFETVANLLKERVAGLEKRISAKPRNGKSRLRRAGAGVRAKRTSSARPRKP